VNQFSEAVSLYQQGKSSETRAICVGMLKLEPSNPQLLALHGAACASLGLRDEALLSLQRALRVIPNHAPTHYALGNVQRELGQHQSAVLSYQQALAHKPDFNHAWINLGLVHHELGNVEEAVCCYKRALGINPADALALYNLGNALQQASRFSEAVVTYEQALEICPHDSNIVFNLANSLLAAGKIALAIDKYQRAHQLRPDHVSTLVNLGVALRRLERYGEALEVLDEALLLDSKNGSALLTRANVLHEIGHTDGAVESLLRVTQLEPDNADAFFNLGNILHCSKQLEPARDAYQRACELKQNHALYLGALVGTQMALWSEAGIQEASRMLFDCWETGKAVPLDMLMELSDDPQLHHQCARKHAEEQLQKYSCDQLFIRDEPEARQHYRIAYLSPDFGNHPVGLSLVEVLERTDRTRFEVIGLSLQRHPDSEIRSRMVDAFDEFHELSNVDVERGIAFIRDLQLDLVVDLAGYTAESRPAYLASRVAPVQVGYLGYPGTLGAQWLDYVIADRYVIPEESFENFSEKIAWLPDSFFPTDTTLDPRAVIVSRKQEGLPEEAFVFCSFNNAKRITPGVMRLWLSLLASIGDSVLWLQRPNQMAENHMRAMALECGVDPNRLIFARFAESRLEHIARHRLADLYLDTFPYNSHSTARDALYAGLPVLTCSGRSYASRVVGSLLTALRLPELITNNFDQYQRRAIALGHVPHELQLLRAKLTQQIDQSTLFDAKLLARNLEELYKMMIGRARADLPATHVALRDDQSSRGQGANNANSTHSIVDIS
jgi:protein O-GlcNAc transferase